MDAPRGPLHCQCGHPLKPEDERCPECATINPHFVAESRSPPEPQPPEPLAEEAEPDETPPAAAAAVSAINSGFDELLEELADAHNSGCKVIANVGYSESGKSWFIARMGRLRGATRTTLYSTLKPKEEIQVESNTYLARTKASEAYVWHLMATENLTNIRSGNWLVVDVAGELVSKRTFFTEKSRFHDVLFMTLAHASAIVLMVDGRPLAEALSSTSMEPGGPGFIQDEKHVLLMNRLIQLIRLIDEWKRRNGGPPQMAARVAEMREWLQANHHRNLGKNLAPIPVPMLMLTSKGDALIQLEEHSEAVFEAPGPDPTRFAESLLKETHELAKGNFGFFRWGFVAPFVGQPAKTGADPDPSEKIHFGRPSFGVTQALSWLDEELRPRILRDPLLTRDALHRIWRWRPHMPTRKRGP
jgi:hypothetical protein